MTRVLEKNISKSFLNYLCAVALWGSLGIFPASAVREIDQDSVQRAARLDMMVPAARRHKGFEFDSGNTRNKNLPSLLAATLKEIPQDQRDDVEAKALSLWNNKMSGESLLHIVRIFGKVQEADRPEVAQLTNNLLLPLTHRESEFCDLVDSIACVPSGEREAVTRKAKHYVEEMIPEDSRTPDNSYGQFLRTTYYPRFVRYISAVESFKREHFFQCLDSVFQTYLGFSDRESITQELSACPTMAARDQFMSSLQSRAPLRARYGWLPQGSVVVPKGGWYVPSTYNPPYLRGIRLNKGNQ